MPTSELLAYGECIADAFGGFRIVPLRAKFINGHSVSLNDVCSQAVNGTMYGVMSMERFLDVRPRTNVRSDISRPAQLGLEAPYELSAHFLPPYTQSAIDASDPPVFFVGFYRLCNVNANIKFINADCQACYKLQRSFCSRLSRRRLSTEGAKLESYNG